MSLFSYNGAVGAHHILNGLCGVHRWGSVHGSLLRVRLHWICHLWGSILHGGVVHGHRLVLYGDIPGGSEAVGRGNRG